MWREKIVDEYAQRARQRMLHARTGLTYATRWAQQCFDRMRSCQSTLENQHWCGESITAHAELTEAAIVYQDALDTYLGLVTSPLETGIQSPLFRPRKPQLLSRVRSYRLDRI
jgi:hypothetical protein